MKIDKLLSAIGMAYASNNVVSGNKLLEQIKENKVSFVVISSNMGASQKKKIIDKCNSKKVEYISDVITKEQLAKACGKPVLVAIGLKNYHFIRLIKSTL
ncbi:L7Ae/L30e/S12e/Gadd45 family ribosomal protein [Mycoplasma putrefaciens]|uniref:50S ribosomal protein, L7Ae family n=2 Tax=Mycoplasma putrefaciens TaxID=2123 RepID=M9WH29_9MOLU|nr:ribosomal L7Ae/L30e/S12e/Gadd45 family protein [Mycoplasma putrefaciens]AEM68842.1 uncharacterized protein MPUT_0471 [Mycoplasma putrefaciens KS1]AGJ90760.1 50S ribosomal protein, L7Ae family [Mycoplasma putrefaciens Mput9231]SYV96161.1 50S ribosomal protein, L7Ae family [Mycoplasma putrefaciens]